MQEGTILGTTPEIGLTVHRIPFMVSILVPLLTHHEYYSYCRILMHQSFASLNQVSLWHRQNDFVLQ